MCSVCKKEYFCSNLKAQMKCVKKTQNKCQYLYIRKSRSLREESFEKKHRKLFYFVLSYKEHKKYKNVQILEIRRLSNLIKIFPHAFFEERHNRLFKIKYRGIKNASRYVMKIQEDFTTLIPICQFQFSRNSKILEFT